MFLHTQKLKKLTLTSACMVHILQISHLFAGILALNTCVYLVMVSKHRSQFCKDLPFKESPMVNTIYGIKIV